MISAFPPVPLPCFADSLFLVWGGATYVASVILTVCMAVCVYQDARRLEAEGLRVVLFGPWLWTLLTLLFSIAAAAFYWAANRSRLRPREPRRAERPRVPLSPPKPLPSQQPGPPASL